ncbi:MAG: hypothetical protein ACX98W_20540 [bacterium]
MAAVPLGSVPAALDFKIVLGDREAAAVGEDLDLYVSAQAGEPAPRLFKRRGLKMPLGAGQARAVFWLVGEVNGVRCYVSREDGKVRIRMTTEDINP